ncbi:hypothetical protein NAT47_04880 [Flavobacterium sp. HXWNR69]|uniref:DUF1574 domain-containing protein n=1 Tax=Flavobacterium fragile TaxID=2949085 RepID=A0ABT0TFI4_9FLAO|nr:hypothetical protein [Flavobacterium sp. HXWNR69]MCL9769745.1 hypothetical protein [Flavobacterium sp. HXWNR69]
MKPFLIFIGKILLVLLLSAFSFDLVYTHVYETSSPRTKFQYFRTFKKDTLDYIFLGSSRVENSLVISEIEKQTGKSALNLGFQAAKMEDIYTLLQLIKAYEIHTETIFIQVDYIFNIQEGYSNVLQYEVMPYVRDNSVTKSYLNHHFEHPSLLYYFPFYRFSDYDSKIGFREFVLNVLGKQTTIQKEKGFVGLDGQLDHCDYELPSSVNEQNVYFNQIQDFAKKNDMNIVYYFSPMSLSIKNKDYVAKLQGKIPKLHDFSSVVKDDLLFQDCTHLNRKGATFFTQYFIDTLLTD